jgi:endonuclease YncB( thermonuclease family)
MKFTPGRGGELETHIRKNSNRQGEYRSVIDNMMGYTFLKYVKGADRINKRIANGSRAPIRDKWADIQLIASGNNISYIVNGKVVASTKDDRLKKGAAMFAVTSKSELCIDDIVIKQVAKTEETETVVAKKVETSDSDPIVSKIIEVTHGDKLIVDIAEPHELAGSNIKVSLKDIDAPDANRSCPKQMELGLKVRDFVAQKLENASSIKLTNFRKTNTKIISQVIVDGMDLGEALVSKGYASEEYGFWKPYFCSALSATNQADQYIDTDQKKAIFWYERSIVLDPDGTKNQESHFALSKIYSNFGNADKALENLKKSASLEWTPAMEQLGSDYLNGNGVKKDPNQGKKWLKKAFDKGSQRAEDIYCGSLPKAKQKTCKF